MYSNSNKYIILILLAMLIMVGCKHRNEPEAGDAIVFSAQQIEPQAETRATGLEHVHTDFKVYGYKVYTTAIRGTVGLIETVMNGYKVWWQTNTAGTTTSNTADWEYVGAMAPSQSIKYWDYESTYYYFLGYTPVSAGEGVSPAVTIDNSGLAVVTPNVAKVCLDVKQTLGYAKPEILISKGIEVKHAQMLSNHQVNMEFVIPMAKVRVGFFTSDYTLPQYTLTDIKFRPAVVSPTIPSEATVRVTYPIRNAANEAEAFTAATQTPTATVTALTYEERDGLPKHSSLPTTAADPVWAYPKSVDPSATPELIYYYTFPQPGDTPWELSMKIKNTDETERIAVVPAEYMRWEPNKQYTYLFKVTATAIVLEVVEVDSWKVFEQSETVTTW